MEFNLLYYSCYRIEFYRITINLKGCSLFAIKYWRGRTVIWWKMGEAVGEVFYQVSVPYWNHLYLKAAIQIHLTWIEFGYNTSTILCVIRWSLIEVWFSNYERYTGCFLIAPENPGTPFPRYKVSKVDKKISLKLVEIFLANLICW